MATNFPSSLDNFTNPVSGNTLDSPSHSLQHSDANDAIEAIEAKLGVGDSPAGSATAGQVLTISAAGTSNWSTPTRDGLVQVIATSVAVGSGSGSVDANGAVTFSGASSISLNGCFTSTYDNYRIIISCKTNTSVDQMIMRLRASGSDNTTSNYYYSTFGLDSSAASIALAKGDPQSYFRIGATADDTSLTEITLSEPFTSKKTSYSQSSTLGFATNEAHFEVGGGFFNGTTSFDGFTFYMASLTLTGTVRVYGYRN